MKIVFFETEKWQKHSVKMAFPSDEIVFVEDPLTLLNASDYSDANVVSTFIHSKLPKEVIDLLPHLKFVATRSTGFDHIDFKYCQTKNIGVTNVPHYGENTVAEYTFALILSLSRKIFQTYERTEHLDFHIDDSIQGFDLAGKTIGVYGVGSIGNYVVKMAHGFGMKILGYKRTPDQELIDKYGVEFVPSIEEILRRSDVITFHCPLMPETSHLVNLENYTHIKKGAILVNTSRGGLVDTTALLKALDEGYLSGVGLDVFEEEQALVDPVALLNPEFRKQHNVDDVLKSHILAARHDVILTPHNAFNTREAVQRILDTTLENIQGFMSGKLQNTVGERC